MPDETIVRVKIDLIRPGCNDRTVFDPVALQELADSIKEHGLQQHIIVRPISQCTSEDCGVMVSPPQTVCPACQSEIELAHYEIIAGERRWRACKLAGLEEVPAVIRQQSDESASVVMLIENIDRADLDDIDEGFAYVRRMEQFGWTVEELARRISVSQSRIQFRIKVVKNLRPEILQLVRTKNLQFGYALVLANAELDPNRQMLAVTRLRDNPNPTLVWFRRMCGELLVEQAQGQLFDLPLMTGDAATGMPQPVERADPPHPTTTTPPKVGTTTREILANQAAFWSDAAGQWDKAGRVFKRKECESAAQALQLALSVV